MRVVESKFLKTRGVNAGAEIAHHGEERGCADRECAGKADVLVAFSVADRRERVDGQVAGNECERLAEKQIVDERVRGEGQVVAVLLDGGGGQHQ